MEPRCTILGAAAAALSTLRLCAKDSSEGSVGEEYHNHIFHRQKLHLQQPLQQKPPPPFPRAKLHLHQLQHEDGPYPDDLTHQLRDVRALSGDAVAGAHFPLPRSDITAAAAAARILSHSTSSLGLSCYVP